MHSYREVSIAAISIVSMPFFGACAMVISSSPWIEAINRLAGSPPTNAAEVEKALSVQLTKVDENRYHTAYLAKDQYIGDVAIEVVDYRLDNNGEGSLLALQIGPTCVPKKLIMDSYPKLQITSLPTGQSLDESVGYSQQERWGKLSFTFTERNPDCLGAVIFSQD